MKPFLGIDITANKKNDQLNGMQFISRKVSQMQETLLAQASEKADAQEEKSQLPKSLRIIRWISMMTALVCIFGVVDALGENADLTLADAYSNAPGIFYAGIIGMILWIGLTIAGKRKKKNNAESDETRRVIATAEQLIKNSYAELHVPDNACNCDILMFRYVVKNGEVLPRSMGPLTFIACDSKVFVDNEHICFADTHQRFDFPLSAIRGICQVHKSGAIPSWNKATPPNQPPYKEYKLTVDSYGFVHFKSYYILELELEGERYGVYFPSYELPAFETLTGHHPQ